MYYVYVLKSIEFDKYYIGFTQDISKRLSEHNSKRSKYTRKYAPWELIYKEEYKIKEEATRREKYLKSGEGRRIFKK